MTGILRAVAGLGVVGLGFTLLSGTALGSLPSWDPSAALLFAAVLAVAVLVSSFRSQWQRAGAWFALLLLGWAAHLQLIRAGPTLGYQHLELPRWAEQPLLILPVAVLILQAVISLWAVRGLATRAVAASRGHVRLWAVATVIVLMGLSAVPSADPVRYALEIVASFALQLVHLSTILMAARAIPPSATEAVARWLERPCESAFPPTAWIAALASGLISALLCLIVYQNHPHVPDEIAYLLPARYFADGRMALALPPVPGGFDVDLIFNDGSRWYSPVPPGWPATLALGVILGVPWLVNPVLAALAVLLTWRLVSSLYGVRTARITTVLLSSSPWLLFMSMSFMTHTLTLTCALAGAVSVIESRRRGVVWPTLLGGAAIGLAGLTRPLDAVAMAGVVGIWALTTPPVRLGLMRAAGLAVGSLAVASWILPYNRYFTGSGTTFPLMRYTDALYGPGTNAMGFGANRGLGWSGLDPIPGHGLVDVVINTVLNASTINFELLGWGTGSLILIGILVASRRLRRTDVGVACAAAFVAALHSLYWFSGGPDFGARYWFLMIVPLMILSARGIEVLDGLLDSASGRGARAATTALALCAVAAVTVVPWRSLDKYRHYRGMEPGIRVLSTTRQFGRSLVLIRGNRHPDYASAAIYNPLDWDADAPIYAWDRSIDIRRALLDAYPDRPVWVVDGPTRTGDGFEVVEGPLPPDSARIVLTR